MPSNSSKIQTGPYLQHNLNEFNKHATNAIIYISTSKLKKPTDREIATKQFGKNCCRLVRTQIRQENNKNVLEFQLEYPIGQGKTMDLLEYRKQLTDSLKENETANSNYYMLREKEGTIFLWHSKKMREGTEEVTSELRNGVVRATCTARKASKKKRVYGKDEFVSYDSDEEEPLQSDEGEDKDFTMIDDIMLDDFEEAQPETPSPSRKKRKNRQHDENLPPAKRARQTRFYDERMNDVAVHMHALGIHSLPESIEDMKALLLSQVTDAMPKHVTRSIMYFTEYSKEQDAYDTLCECAE